MNFKLKYMNALKFIKTRFPITAIDFKNKKCFGLEDIAYIAEQYAKYKIQNLKKEDEF